MITEREIARVNTMRLGRQEIREMTGPHGTAVLRYVRDSIHSLGWWYWLVKLNNPPAGFKRTEWTSRSGEDVRVMLATGTLPNN